MNWYKFAKYVINTLNQKVKDRITRDFDKGKTVQELATKYKLGPSVIKRVLMHSGKSVRNVDIPPEIGELILQDYDAGRSLLNLSHQHNFSTQDIAAFLTSNGRNLRSHKDTSVRRTEQVPFTDELKHSILKDKKSPYYYHQVHGLPIGQVVKFFIDNNIPFNQNYRRYISPAYEARTPLYDPNVTSRFEDFQAKSTETGAPIGELMQKHIKEMQDYAKNMGHA